MLLGKIEIVFAEGFGLQASVTSPLNARIAWRAFSGVKSGSSHESERR